MFIEPPVPVPSWIVLKDCPLENATDLPIASQKIITNVLTCGKKITHPEYLMGGGQWMKQYFLEAIGNKRYNNAFEWCAGHGELGFEVITSNLCNTLSFSDLHPKSTEWCLKNALDLSIADRVESFVTDKISNIPKSKLWDLVIGNPPNSIDIDPAIMKRGTLEGWPESKFQMFHRTTWDVGFEAHTEFFKNIGAYTTNDVDLFLSVDVTLMKYAQWLAEQNNFEIVGLTNMGRPDSSLKVVHFKKKILTM